MHSQVDWANYKKWKKRNNKIKFYFIVVHLRTRLLYIVSLPFGFVVYVDNTAVVIAAAAACYCYLMKFVICSSAGETGA